MNGAVSVVIPARHAPTLPAALAALRRQTCWNRIDAIWVAGEQEPGPWLDSPKVRYLPVERPSAARNRNAAAAQAGGEWLAFTDADGLPAPDWLEQALWAGESTAAAPPAAVAGSVALPAGASYWARCDHYFGFEGVADGLARSGPIESGVTLNLLVRRAWFERLRGFDERFPGAAGEDLDFCARLRQAGGAIWLAPAAVVVHDHPRRSLASAWRHCYGYGRANIRYWERAGARSPWSRWQRLIRLPLLGEAGAVLRWLARAAARPLRRPAYWRLAHLLPGLAVLDAGHALGILHGTRARDG